MFSFIDVSSAGFATLNGMRRYAELCPNAAFELYICASIFVSMYPSLKFSPVPLLSKPIPIVPGVQEASL